MAEINYENIDLFYYHSIDFDFSRFISIINHGILSSQAAIDMKLPYYYRNYTHSSTGNEYISVNHFPRSLFRVYKMDNELYDYNTNKICFILDDVIPLEKQKYRSKYQYTNERHVHYKINQTDIKGILIREIDAKKLIVDIAFNYKYTDEDYFERKVFTTIKYYSDNFGCFPNLNDIYHYIGKIREAKVYGYDVTGIYEQISRYMKISINEIISKLTNIKNPTLLDTIKYFNNNTYPIYTMNRFDLEPIGTDLIKTHPKIEELKREKKITELRKKDELNKKILKLLKKMSPTGVDIMYDYVYGPLEEYDNKIKEEINELKLKYQK